jgi:hypothetical protein
MSRIPRRKKWLELPRFIIPLFQQTWYVLINILKQFINYVKTKILQIIKYLKERKQAWYVLLFMLISFGIVFAGIWPSENNFEGSLVVKEIGFTYNGQEPNKLFINNINGIKRLLLDGRQTLILTGKFSSSSHPELNQKLTQLNTLKIELPYDNSQWMIATADSKLESKLKLTELRLQPQTTIDSLSYDPYNQRLAFSLLPEVATGEIGKPNFILDLGEQPLKISFNGYKLPELDLQNSSDSSNQIEFIFQPNNPEVRLSISNNTRLSIDLPDPSKVDYEDKEWLRGNLAVKNMQFQELDRTGINTNDDLEKSTIIKGDITMKEQQLKVESNQFLITGEPGIERLRHLAIIPSKTTPEVELRINGESVEISEAVEGIEARIAGKAKRIQVGIDPRFPVNSIQSNYLASWGLSKDLIISIIPFLLGVIVSLLTWLVNDFLSWLKPNSASSPNS